MSKLGVLRRLGGCLTRQRQSIVLYDQQTSHSTVAVTYILPWFRQLSSKAAAASDSEGAAATGLASGKYDLADFPPDRIRNFAIIAHIDHGR